MDISDWLLCDFWEPSEAALLMSGVNPHGTDYRTLLPTVDTLFDGAVFCLDGATFNLYKPDVPAVWDQAVMEYFQKVEAANAPTYERRKELARNVIRVLNLLERSLLPPKSTPLAYVDWALSKGISIPWDKSVLQNFPAFRTKAESPHDRRSRLALRVMQEKTKGTKAFLKVVAEEEGIGKSRLQQILKAASATNAKPKQNSTNTWQAVLDPEKQTNEKNPKGKR